MIEATAVGDFVRRRNPSGRPADSVSHLSTSSRSRRFAEAERATHQDAAARRNLQTPDTRLSDDHRRRPEACRSVSRAGRGVSGPGDPRHARCARNRSRGRRNGLSRPAGARRAGTHRRPAVSHPQPRCPRASEGQAFGPCTGLTRRGFPPLPLPRFSVRTPSVGLWRSLVSASVWGTEGRRFESC